MNDQKLAFISGAALGLLGVVAGAMGAHALENTLTADLLGSYETAVRFQMFHSLLLLILGLVISRGNHLALRLSIRSILVGTLMFSGSIYLLVLTPVKVGIITPIGGLFLIAGWACLLWWGIVFSAR